MRRDLFLFIVTFWLISCTRPLTANGAPEDNAKHMPILLGILRESFATNISAECRQDAQVAHKSLIKREIWALKMLDSSGDIETNFIWQNNYWLGSREFCDEINNPVPVYIEKRTKESLKLANDLPPFPFEYRLLYGDITSQHQIQYERVISTVLHLGLCLPKSCSNSDVLTMTQNYFNEHKVSPFFDINVQFNHVKNLKFNWDVFNDWIFKVTGAIILGLIALHVLGARENMRNYPKILHYCRHFSIKDNYRGLVSSTEDPKIVYSLNFFRVLCSTWVTLNHVYLFSYIIVESIPLNGMRTKTFYIRSIYRSALMLDVFFLMSGFVLIYNFLKNHELCEKIRRNSLSENAKLFCKHILNRYLRFMPTLIATLILSRITHLIFDSIFYRDMDHNYSFRCKWWMWNIFFIQNFLRFSEMAAVWTWSLASDLQCFIIFQLLLFVFIKYPKQTKYLFVVLVSACTYISYKSVYDTIYAEYFEFSFLAMIYIVDGFYMKAYYRMLPYACGILTGYICYQTIGKEVVISSKIRKLFWTTTFIAFGIIVFYSESYVPNFTFPFLFTFGRIGYTLLAGVLILFGQWGYCNWVNRIGKMPFIVKISKLSFSQYMLHPIVIYIILGSHNDVIFSSYILVISFCITTTIFTYYISVIFYVLIESPFNRLFDDIMQMKGKKKKTND